MTWIIAKEKVCDYKKIILTHSPLEDFYEILD